MHKARQTKKIASGERRRKNEVERFFVASLRHASEEGQVDVAGRLECPYCVTRPRMLLIDTEPNWRLSIELTLLSPTTKQRPAGIVRETTW
jgi:hypothetical protein